MKRSQRAFVVLVFALSAILSLAQQPLSPPVAPRIDHREIRHGETVADQYFWLREKSNPEVRKYLESENAYTRALTRGMEPLQEQLYKEMLGRIKQTDISVPARQGRYYYYSRTEQGKQYPIYCRKPAAAGGALDERAAELVMLDQNEMASGLPFLSIGESAVSADDNLLAYSTDTTGFRQYALHFKDLRTGRILPDTAERVTSAEWAADNKTLFFVTEDQVTKRSNRLWRLSLGSKPEPVFEEKDELYTINIGRTRDKKYLLLRIRSTDTWESRYLDAAVPAGRFATILPREKGHKYDVEHRAGLFYIRTNKGAANFTVVTAPVASVTPAGWKEFIPHKPDVLLDRIDLFRDYAVAHEQWQALSRFRVLNFGTGTWHEITFPEQVYAAFGGENPAFDTKLFRFNYQSMVTIDRTLGANMERLRAFFGADSCVVVLSDADQVSYSLRRATAAELETVVRAEPVSAGLVATLLSFGERAAVWCRSGIQWWHRATTPGDESLCLSVGEVLGCAVFMTVPMRSRDRVVGRLFLTAQDRCFKTADLDFLSQAVDNIMPVLDNIVLVDRMATRAAEEERRRIARDIHDTIIQPYIGLQYGITAIRQLCDVARGDPLPLLKERTSRLQALAASGMADLRQYVHRLKHGEGPNGGFVQTLRRFAARFNEATGIEVEVKAAPDFHLNDRLAAEVFSMLEEALSNIRRHTRAMHGSIELKTEDERLVVLVQNETGTDGPPRPFVPRSIAERAVSLEGSVRVKTLDSRRTTVTIEIPL